LKFTQDALLNAAATIVAARLQAQAASGPAHGSATRISDVDDSVSHMLLQAMTEVLEATELMEDHAKNNLDLWARVGAD
jgi:hypothetical protein